MRFRTLVQSFFVAALLPAFAHGATVTTVGSDTGASGTKDAWRTSSVVKPLDGDSDNIYGSAGYLLFRFNSASGSVAISTTGSATVNTLPSYLTAGAVGADLMYGAKSAIDNPAGGADVASGIAFRNTTASSGVEFAFMKITLAANLPSGIRLGVLTNNSGGTDIPLSIRLAQTTGTGTDSVMYSVPNENQPDWYFFDITGGVGGDVFTLFTTSRGGKPTIGGLTVDLIPTPAALPAGLTLLGLTSMRRRR